MYRHNMPRVQACGKARGWSQAERVERIGVHVADLSRLETGKSQPSLDTAKRAAAALEVSQGYGMDGEADEWAPVSVEGETLSERLALLSELSEEDRKTAINVIDALLTRKKMIELVRKNAA